ncbi:MAG: helix-turn-helix transcriptional regulator [Burkholderiaceae bacterium]|nr:helix-turn-helix transcriptional regulator [Burkholderiaceae bacterium]
MTVADCDWSQTIGALLRQAEDCLPTLDQLAAAVNTTPRTLTRRLAREGTSFRNLALQVRNRRARELLAEGRLSISQIAYALGYTDLANFSRSFKRVCGVAPSAYVEAANIGRR